MAVKSVTRQGKEELTKKDFKVRYYFELIPRRAGGIKETYKIFKFYDYAPHVFLQIRNMYGITRESYIQSIGTQQMLRSLMKGNLNTLSELISSGKSGAFFYRTADRNNDFSDIHGCLFFRAVHHENNTP